MNDSSEMSPVFLLYGSLERGKGSIEPDEIVSIAASGSPDNVIRYSFGDSTVL